MRITLINPPLIHQKNDPHTGIIFMPFMLAYLSSYLKEKGNEVQVLDAFGEAPNEIHPFGKMAIQGLSIRETVERVSSDTEAVFIHFQGVAAYQGIVEIARDFKRKYPKKILILMENSQAATAFSVRAEAENLLNKGFDLLLYGDCERTAAKLLENLKAGSPFPREDGFIFFEDKGELFCSDKIPLIKELDELPFPDWEAFPLRKYWDIGYAHGPMEGPYLPLLTSRGCPLICHFCIIPSTNDHRWRARSPVNVVDEIDYFQKKLSISEFHIEDVNPTVNNQRIVDICNEIIKRGLKVKWKFVSGTKIETMKLETIPLLAKAGCNFISFSPESGSSELLKKMHKPFDHDLAYRMVKLSHHNGIYTQACFVLGFPEETRSDVVKTARYIRKLTLAGLDEIAQFIVTPIPGSAIFDRFSGYHNFSELTFSPVWRKDYQELATRRKKQYLLFLIYKLIRYPHKVLRQVTNIFRGRFQTKMEQALYRVTIRRFLNWKQTYGK